MRKHWILKISNYMFNSNIAKVSMSGANKLIHALGILVLLVV